MANYGKAFGIPAKKYAVNLAIEQITSKAIPSSYSNPHMQRGHEQEPFARALYENETFCDVTNGGFFESESIGCSPDGLVDSDGVIEIKSVIASVHYDTIRKGGFDSAYKWQLIGNLYFTGRDWIDYISYCAEFPEGKQLHVYRLNKGDYIEEFKMIESRCKEFLEVVKNVKTKILENN
jgi:hypothetical protein